MDLVALRAELTTDPLTRNYASMSDGQAATSLNTVNRTVNKAIPAQDLHAWFVFAGKWPAIEAEAAGTAGTGGVTANSKLAAQSFIEICHYFGDLDMRQSQYSSGILFILDQFVTRSIITSAQRTAIVALGTGPVSRAEELNLGNVTHLDVAAARNG